MAPGVQLNQWSVKYRPAALDDFIGPDSVKSIAHAVVRDANHAILIHGESGCGKTTLARIIGNMRTSNADDILEKNIGADRSIEMIRGLIETASYKPRGECRVFILDEAHALQGPAQSAILKLLEEPPHSGVCFILCTDRPHMLERPLIGRLRQIEVRKADHMQLARLLYRVINAEKAFSKYTKDQRQRLVKEVAQAADCVPRNALQLLSNAAASANEFESFKDLIIQGIRKAAEESLYKVALKVLMSWYSPELPLPQRAEFLTKLIAERDAYGLLKSVVNVHYEVMMASGGVTSQSGGFYTRELATKNAIPALHVAVAINQHLITVSNTLLQANVNLSQLVNTELLHTLYRVDALIQPELSNERAILSSTVSAARH